MSTWIQSPYGGGGGTQPWQFRPESYGAVGNGQVCADVTTNGTTTITSAKISADPAAVGKTVMINGANGTTSGPLIATINSVSGTNVVLSSAAGASQVSCQAVWGTDDTAAFNSAFSAALTYALANNYRAQVLCKDKIYMLTAAPTQSTGPTYNTQVKIPFSDLTGATQKLMIDFLGAGAHQGTAQFFQSSTPNLSGTCLVSTQTAPSTPDPTFGVQSVVGGPSGGGSFTAGFANTHVHIDGIEIFCPVLTNMKAWNLGFLAGATWGSFAANIFAPATQGTHPQLTDLPALGSFQGSKGVGCIFPYNGNNDDVAGTRFAVEGYETCVSIQDHFSCLNLMTVYADLAILYASTQGGSGNSNLVYIGNWSCEAYNGGFLADGGYVTLDARMTTETASGADPSYDVKDQGSNIHGYLSVADNNGRTNRRPVVTNCANLAVVNNMLGPGHWATPPSVPSSTTAQQNTGWRDAWVSVHCGAGVTVSVIAVDGTTTGLTVAAASSTAVRVPSGKNITLTYAGGTPTWDWWLD